MPILLDSCRVIRPDRVKCSQRFWKLNRDFIFSSARCVTSADFIPQRPKSVVTTDGEKLNLRKCAKCEAAFYKKEERKENALREVPEAQMSWTWILIIAVVSVSFWQFLEATVSPEALTKLHRIAAQLFWWMVVIFVIGRSNRVVEIWMEASMTRPRRQRHARPEFDLQRT